MQQHLSPPICSHGAFEGIANRPAVGECDSRVNQGTGINNSQVVGGVGRGFLLVRSSPG